MLGQGVSVFFKSVVQVSWPCFTERSHIQEYLGSTNCTWWMNKQTKGNKVEFVGKWSWSGRCGEGVCIGLKMIIASSICDAVKRATHTPMATMKNDQKNPQNTLGISCVIKTCLYLQLLTFLLGIYAREINALVKTKISTSMHSSPVYNRQKLRVTACISRAAYLESTTFIS